MRPSWHSGVAGDEFSPSAPTQDGAALVANRGLAAKLSGVSKTARLAPWFALAAWIAVAVFGGAALDEAISATAADHGSVLTWTSAAAWTIGAVALALRSVVTLTIVRVLVPVGVPVAAAAWSGGAQPVVAAAFAAAAVVATAAVTSADLGRAFVQAGAYGLEQRFLLRAPAAYLIVTIATWAVWAALAIGAPWLIAFDHITPGLAVGAAAAISGAWAWRRWHLLSLRWFVIVPAGLVIHDRLVLAETAMLRAADVRDVRLAPADTDAADLTGPASGHAVEIRTVIPVTVLVAASERGGPAKPIHLTGCLVAPSRPGQAIAAATSAAPVERRG